MKLQHQLSWSEIAELCNISESEALRWNLDPDFDPEAHLPPASMIEMLGLKLEIRRREMGSR